MSISIVEMGWQDGYSDLYVEFPPDLTNSLPFGSGNTFVVIEAIDSYGNSWAFQEHWEELSHEFFALHHLGFFAIITILNGFRGLS